ncbi:MAG: PKD domain-containing protein [Anaerolineales bacterium]|nr:MAG: PKD domain-containing protein [Anaerolineales bacterium]
MIGRRSPGRDRLCGLLVRFARVSLALTLISVGLLASERIGTSAAIGQAAPGEERSARVILRLQDPPLALAAAAESPGTVQATRYLQRLEQAQQLVAARVERALSGSVIERSYQVTFNGLAVRLLRADARALQTLSALPGVSAVYEETTFEPALYASVPAIGTVSLWAQLGGSDVAGAGIKIAILDSGIDVSHPMFDAAAFDYPESFPKGDDRYTTPKVIAARAYFRPTDPPMAGEESPVPASHGSGHGTHIAGIAAGNVVTATYHGLSQEISGVAPQAWLMNYRIFYPTENGLEAAYTAEILQAIEDAVVDGADVICATWASVSPRMPFASPVAGALESAIEAGCVVVAAAGNDGPAYGSASRLPGGMERLITVGSVSKDRVVARDFAEVTGPEPVDEDLQGQSFELALFGAEIEEVIGPLLYVDVADVAPGGSALACEALAARSLTGTVAVIARGECYFADKAYNAQQAGAALALIYNDSDQVVEMGCSGEHCGSGESGIVIPAAMVSQSFGQGLLTWLDEYPTATVQLDPDARIVTAVADIVQSSSGRGPAYMRYLKPDLVAPGASVLSAHLGSTYAQLSGSSVACAHLAGGAALLLQAHPAWGHDEVKAALMATSRVSGIATEGSPSTQASLLERGSGLVDLAAAGEPVLLFTPPSLTIPWGLPARSYSLPVTVRDTRDAGDTLVFVTSVSASEGITVSVPMSVAIAVGSTTALSVSVEIPGGAAPGDQEAEVHFVHGHIDVHLPIWVHVEPLSSTAEVLLIDNDFSLMESYVDYAPYVTNTLQALGYSYQVWSADARFSNPQTVPDLDYLQRFDAVIWLTGDHTHADGYYVMSTPLTALDMQILASYLDGGGRLLALGQNLAEASDVNPSADPKWGRADLLHHYLGAHWLQGSLFDPEGEGLYPPSQRPSVVGMSGTFLEGMMLDIGQEGDGDGSHTSVDEIGPGGLPDGSDLDLVQPLMMTLESSPVGSGYVAVAKGAEPTLEDEQLSFPYRTVYYSFGFERVNNNPGVTSRAQLLGRTLDWLFDQVEVSVGEAVGSPNDLTRIACEVTSSVTSEVSSYRWRIGGGEDAQIVSSTESFIVHVFATRGDYEVAVEATDTLGHRAVGHGTVSIVQGGSSTLTVTPDTAPAGSELTYEVVARNTGTATLPITFTLPLPASTDYVAHAGGTFEGDTLSWNATLSAGEAFTGTLWVRAWASVTPRTDLVATAQFQAEDDSFTKSATVSVVGRVWLPLIVKE